MSWLARSRGLIDPIRVISRLESFAQPTEVKEPLELLRAGMVFHARGLLNTGAIQHNLDWIWPFWVERQYDPNDDAFIPRAFSITHVNLSHRNWTAIGLPDWETLPVVDPRGLVMPFWDSWSLDAWIVETDDGDLFPSRAESVSQSLDCSSGLAVVTRASLHGVQLENRAEVLEMADGTPVARVRLSASSRSGGWLVLSLRPYNPEGVSFVQRVSRDDRNGAWQVDRKDRVELSPTPERQRFSHYRGGDVHALLPEGGEQQEVHCRVGMATAAALWPLAPGEERRVEARVPLTRSQRGPYRGPGWDPPLERCPRLEIFDSRFCFLYEAAVRTLLLHSPREVYPGPFTYKRFWFRDAAFMLDALLALNQLDRVERTLDLFPGHQTRAGHFLSQDGEWDSNGEALWILERFCRISDRAPSPTWRRAIRKGGRWITRKRMPGGEAPHAGLLPPGFSAEHLGPNDYYYWDDFWGVAGLRCAASLLERYGEDSEARRMIEEAHDLEAATVRSLEHAAQRLGRPAMPASPYRRLDSGAVGSLAAGYPLQLWSPRDPRLLDTAEYILESCFVEGGFFQDVIHSGINPYLTLHVAQVLQRAGDPRAGALLRRVGELASPTGQWPEAIHPRTLGGCMGDGQHAWAAAEWILALRNAFVREEDDGLVVGAGIDAAWLENGATASFGPTPTSHGPVTVRAVGGRDGVEISCEGEWRGEAPQIRIATPQPSSRRHSAVAAESDT